MDKKQNSKNATSLQKEPTKKSSNKALWWILGGCLTLVVISSLVLGGIAYWSYKKVKKEIKENKRKFEQAVSEAEKSAPGAGTGTAGIPGPTSIPEDPVSSGGAVENEVPLDINPPVVTEKAVGYLKKVYTKGGKNCIDIDYVQWLSGDVAERAMREDGECPKKGECIVLNDYYIRNQNPLIRTFEVAPEAEILAHDFSADYQVGNWNESWTFLRFSNYFNASANNGYWDSAPFHVEIGNNQVLKITEQYIP